MASRGRRDASQDNCTILVRLSKCWASPHKTQQTERAIQTQSNCRPLFERRKKTKQHTLTTRISHDGPTGNATGKQLTHETSGNPFLYYILSLFLSRFGYVRCFIWESRLRERHTRHRWSGVGGPRALDGQPSTKLIHLTSTKVTICAKFSTGRKHEESDLEKDNGAKFYAE